MPTHGFDAGQDAVRESGSRGAVVAAHGEPGRTLEALPRERSNGLTDGARDLGRELLAHGAANVVLAKDGSGEFHVRPPSVIARSVWAWRPRSPRERPPRCAGHRRWSAPGRAGGWGERPVPAVRRPTPQPPRPPAGPDACRRAPVRTLRAACTSP